MTNIFRKVVKKEIFKAKKIVPMAERQAIYPLIARLSDIRPMIYPNYCIYGNWFTMSYAEILANYKLNNYKKILIYGANADLAILINEIKKQAPQSEVIGVVTSGEFKLKYVPVLSLEKGLEVADCIIINENRDTSDIRYELNNMSLKVDSIDVFDIDRFVTAFNHPELACYKNIYNRKRCFIIGNGPSLSVDDLNTLHRNNEICFASNAIYKMFGRTEWRPNFYTASDDLVTKTTIEEIKKIEGEIFIADLYNIVDFEKVNQSNIHYIHMNPNVGYMNHPGFSDDVVTHVFDGGSCVYDMSLQLAVYMGFTEIYLLGVDNTVGITNIATHFDGYYTKEEEEKVWKPKFRDNIAQENYELLNRAFESGKQYCKKNGIELLNATRGGRLNVLDRVLFDSLFH